MTGGKARIIGSDTEEGLWRNKISLYRAAQQGVEQVGATYQNEPTQQSHLQDRKFMRRAGGVFEGTIGFEQGFTRLVTGTNDIDLLKDLTGAEQDKIFRDYVVTLDSGTTGTLTTISGRFMDGQRILMRGIAGNTITITHTAAATVDAIKTQDDTNFTWSDDSVVELQYDAAVSQWRLLTGAAGGSVQDKIEEGNSSVEVVDTGVDAEVIFKLNGTSRLTLRDTVALGLQLDVEVNILMNDNEIRGVGKITGASDSDGTIEFANTSIIYDLNNIADIHDFRILDVNIMNIQDDKVIFNQNVDVKDGFRVQPRASSTNFIALRTKGDTIIINQTGWVGTLQLPHKVSTDDSPSTSILNDWFGNVDGCAGVQFDDDTPDVFTLWIKSNSAWHRWTSD